MIDLHCHILPGVDDGPQSLDETLEMARFYVDDGIHHVVATPHCHRYIHLLRDDILPHVARLNETLQREGLDLTIYPGSEIQVTDPVVYKREFQNHLYCHLGDGDAFTLLEFNWARDLFPADAPKRKSQTCFGHIDRAVFVLRRPRRGCRTREPQSHAT